MRTRGRGALRVAAALVLATGAPECGPDVAATGDVEEAGRGIVASAARWTLAWDRAGVEPSPGGGWSVETDLGYRVRLASGALVLHSVSLGPCEAPRTGEGDGGGTARGEPIEGPIRGPLEALGRRLRGAISERAAHAHEDSDPSEIGIDIEEDLADPVDLGPLHARFAAARYCRAHWLVARSDLEGGDPFARLSLRVEGEWERGGRTGSFSLRTWWPEGRLVELEQARAKAGEIAGASFSGGTARAAMRVERRLATIFDGIDFETASEAGILGRALQNVVGDARVTAALEPDE